MTLMTDTLFPTLIGKVRNVVRDRGFLFIRVPEGEDSYTDYFAHRSVLRGLRIETIQEGATVIIEANPYAERGPRALQVSPAPPELI